VDRWAGGWPAKTRKLETEGRLFEAVKEQVEIQEQARHYLGHHPDMGMTEVMEMFDIPLHPPE